MEPLRFERLIRLLSDGSAAASMLDREVMHFEGRLSAVTATFWQSVRPHTMRRLALLVADGPNAGAAARLMHACSPHLTGRRDAAAALSGLQVAAVAQAAASAFVHVHTTSSTREKDRLVDLAMLMNLCFADVPLNPLGTSQTGGVLHGTSKGRVQAALDAAPGLITALLRSAVPACTDDWPSISLGSIAILVAGLVCCALTTRGPCVPAGLAALIDASAVDLATLLAAWAPGRPCSRASAAPGSADDVFVADSLRLLAACAVERHGSTCKVILASPDAVECIAAGLLRGSPFLGPPPPDAALRTLGILFGHDRHLAAEVCCNAGGGVAVKYMLQLAAGCAAAYRNSGRLACTGCPESMFSSPSHAQRLIPYAAQQLAFALDSPCVFMRCMHQIPAAPALVCTMLRDGLKGAALPIARVACEVVWRAFLSRHHQPLRDTFVRLGVWPLLQRVLASDSATATMRCAAAEAVLLLLYCAEDASHGPAERQQLARPAWHSLISEATSFRGRGSGPEAARSHFLQAALACSPACLPDLAAHPGALTVAAAAAVCAPPRYGAAGQGLELLEQLAACAWRDQGGAEGQDGVVNSSIGTTSWSKLDEQALALVHPTFDAKARDALRMLERHPDGRIAASARDAHAMLVGAQLDVFGLVRDERTGDDRLPNAQQRPISGVGGAVAAAAAAAAPAPAASGSQPEGREAQDALEEQDQQLGADGSVSAGAPAPKAAAPVGQRRASQPRRACATCGKAAGEDGVKLQRCSGCDAARYCGKECAKAGWKAGHREECKAAQLKKQQAKAGQE